MCNPRTRNGHRRRKLLARLKAINAPCWICQLPIDATLPAGHPYAMECDELVPVSKGGSATDFSNTASAHRCCNNWRRNRGIAFVEAMRERVRAMRGAWSEPLAFVEAAKAIEANRDALPPQVQPTTTTEW